MDAEVGFFSLVDPDFFDVPWADAEHDSQFAPAPLSRPHRWHEHADGLWRYFLPQPEHDPLPAAGWKVHVSAIPQHAQTTIDTTAQICSDEHVPWKTIRSARLVHASQSKHAPPSLVGKVCVIYPRDEGQLTRVVTQLAKALDGSRGPRIMGDHHHPSAPVGIRWGAFTQAWVEGPGGHLVPGVREHGRTAPDRRGKTHDKPLPTGVSQLLTASAAAPLPIRNARLIRRHSAGAVYQAVLEGDRPVVLKEARHHAGHDRDGVDAVTRLQHEHTVLQHLSGQAIAPEPLDYWQLQHSDILVMEQLAGETMARRIGRTHPRGQPAVLSEQAAAYWSWAETLETDMATLVARLHALGVAHGDLQPTNVIIGDIGLRLVDFECASLNGTTVTTTTGTPGFQIDTPDPFERDRFALARTQACATDLDVTLLDRRPDLHKHFAAAVAGHPDTSIPDPPSTGVETLLAQLATDLEKRATPQRSDRLFPGGVDQFRSPLGALDVLSGAAGVLLALSAVGTRPQPALLDWLANTAARATTNWHGLGVGIEGVALALALLDRHEQAAALIDRASTDELPQSLTWARGRAGCAVALIELGQLLGRDDMTERGLAACQSVISAVGHPDVRVPGVGLLEGWSGIALALLKISQILPEEAAHVDAAALTALQRERAGFTRTGETLVAESAGRINTSLGNGTGGFVLAVSRVPNPARDLAVAAASAATGCANVYPPVAGLVDGLAGSVAALRTTGRHSSQAQSLEERAGWHCVRTATGWSVLGEQRLRCSDDIRTGTAGLLTGLGPQSPDRLSYVLRIPERMMTPVI